MIVCLCANVSDRAIAQAVQGGSQSVEDIAMQTGACSGCGQCRLHCQSELDAHKALAQINLEASGQTA